MAIDAGIVSAYGFAVAHGYTGTPEQFGEDQANFAANAQQVREDKEDVEELIESIPSDYTTTVEKVDNVTDVIGNLFSDSEAMGGATGITRASASEYVGTASAFQTFILNNYTLDETAEAYTIAFDIYTEANSSSSGTGLEVQYGNHSSKSTLTSFDNDQTDPYHFESFFSVTYAPTVTDRTLGLVFKANSAPNNIWHISNIRLFEGMEIPDAVTAKDTDAREKVDEAVKDLEDLKSSINKTVSIAEFENKINIRANGDLVCMYNQGTYTPSQYAPSYTGTKTYSYLGFTTYNKVDGVFFAKIKVTNIGSVDAPSVKRHTAYNNSPTNPASALYNGTDTGTAINLPVGASTTIYHKFVPEYSPSQYSAIGIGFLFGTVGVTLQIEGRILDVTDYAYLSDAELKTIIDSTPMEYAELELPANSLTNSMLKQLYQWKDKVWSNYGDSISWLYDWHTLVNTLLGFSSFVRNGKPGAPIVWSNSTFGINANGIYTTDTPADTVHEGMCAYDRISKTINKDLPLIFVMGGTNDFLLNTPIGDLTFDATEQTDSAWYTANPIGDYDITTFKGAMASMLMKLQYHAPNALIVFGTLLNGIGATSGVNQYEEQINTLSLKPSDYAEAEKEVCRVFGIPYVDVFSECGISVTNRATYISDTVHPNQAGMKLLGRCVASELGKMFPRST